MALLYSVLTQTIFQPLTLFLFVLSGTLEYIGLSAACAPVVVCPVTRGLERDYLPLTTVPSDVAGIVVLGRSISAADRVRPRPELTADNR